MFLILVVLEMFLIESWNVVFCKLLFFINLNDLYEYFLIFSFKMVKYYINLYYVRKKSRFFLVNDEVFGLML